MPLPGESLEGKYEILEKLGEGGMGAVYKVRHLFLDEFRVVKVMRAALRADKELKNRFVREARVATQLRHPNIAQLYDFSIDEAGNAYIVLEFIAGLTLEDLLERHGPPPIGLTLEVAQQSLRALEYLHRKHFVHRDVSPDNLMLARGPEGEPVVKMIDLGIAKVLEGEGQGFTATGIFLGKVQYSSPEQLDGAVKQLDGRSDLYSFGVVLYELLTGESPIEGTSPPSIMAGHLFHPPRSFDQTDPGGRVPPELRRVIMQALAKKPAERFPSAKAFSQRLTRLTTQYPLADQEVQETLGRILAASDQRPASGGRDGSTQDRLDEQFRAEPTPSPVNRALADSDPGRVALMQEEPTQRLPSAGPAENRQRELAARDVERITAEIESGRFRSAEHLLRDAFATHGNLEALGGLRERLAQRTEEARRERIGKLLENASRKSEAEDFEDALNELEQVLRLDPGNSAAQALLADCREGMERQQREQAAKEIDDLLARGDSESADRRLSEAVARFGAEGTLGELQQRLAELQRVTQVQSLLAEARDCAAREDYRRAIAGLEEALQLAPDHSGAGALLAETRAALARQEAERRRAKAEAEITARLDAGDLDQAERLLAAALPEHGEMGELPPLRRRLAELRRSAQVQRLLAEAGECVAREDYHRAIGELEEALQLAPGHTRAGVLLAETRAALARQEAERRRAAAEAEIVARLDAGDLDQAERLLAAAVAEHGEMGELPGLRQRLAEAREREEEHRRAEAIEQAVREVERLLGKGDLGSAERALDEAAQALGADSAFESLERRLRELREREEKQQEFESLLTRVCELEQASQFDEALKVLEQARGLDSGDRRLGLLQDQIAEGRRRERAEQRVRELREAVAEVERRVVAGELEGAAEQLDAAVEKFGEEASLVELRSQIERAREERRAASARDEATTILPAEQEETVRLEPEHLRRELAQAQARPEAKAIPEPTVLIPAKPATEITPKPAPRKAAIPRLVLPLAAVVVLVVAVVLFWPRSQPTAGTEEGTVIVNAIPWGQVTAIRDREGQSHPLPAEPYTPVLLALPAGDYVIELRNDHFAEPMTVEVRIVAGQPIRSLTTFNEVSVDEFFESLDW